MFSKVVVVAYLIHLSRVKGLKPHPTFFSKWQQAKLVKALSDYCKALVSNPLSSLNSAKKNYISSLTNKLELHKANEVVEDLVMER